MDIAPLLDKTPNAAFEIGGALLRDKAAIVGATGSVGTSVHVAVITAPTSLESWGAVFVSAVTVTYILSKIFILWMDYRSRAK